MTRIPHMEYEQAPKKTNVIYDRLKENMDGRLANIYKVLGNHHGALQGLVGMSKATYRSSDMDPQLAELVYLLLKPSLRAAQN